MNLGLVIFAFTLSSVSFLLGRFLVTSVEIPKGFSHFRAVVQTTSFPEHSESFTTYPIRITHFLQAPQSSHNLQHSVSLKLRLAHENSELNPGSILIVHGLITDSAKIIPFRIEYLSNNSRKLFSSIFSFRKAFEEQIMALLPSEQAKLALGTAIGSSYQFNEDIYSAMRKSGTLHMVVVSGANIVILVKFSMLFFQRLFPVKKSLLFTCVIIVVYAILSGGQPPVLRAAVMGILSIGAQFFGRISISLWTLFLSVVLLASFQPQILASISFQLSVFATLGICILAPIYHSASSNGSILQLAPKQEFITSIAAQVGVAPLLVYYFQEVSLVAIISNILISWTIPPIMLFSVLAGVVGFLNQDVAEHLALVPNILTAYFLKVNLIISQLPGGVLHTKETTLLTTIGIYLLITSIIGKKLVQQNYPEDKK